MKFIKDFFRILFHPALVILNMIATLPIWGFLYYMLILVPEMHSWAAQAILVTLIFGTLVSAEAICIFLIKTGLIGYKFMNKKKAQRYEDALARSYETQQERWRP